MHYVATHHSIIDSLGLRAILDCAGKPTTASAIMAEAYAIHRWSSDASEKLMPSPFIRLTRKFSLKDLLERSGKNVAFTDHYDHKDRGFRMRLTVFSDHSCLITTKTAGPDRRATYLVPWVFDLPQTFQADDGEITIPKSMSRPKFSYSNEAGEDDPGEASLLRSYGPKRKHTLPGKLRHQYLEQLKRDMFAVTKAISKGQPLSTGEDWIGKALDFKAALPPNFSHKPTSPSTPDFAGIGSILRPYIEANFPNAKVVRGQIFGRVVSPNGSVGSIEGTEIEVDGEREHVLGWAIDALLNDPKGPIPVYKQIAQTEQRPQAISHLHLHEFDQSTAHEKVEATILLSRYLRP